MSEKKLLLLLSILLCFGCRPKDPRRERTSDVKFLAHIPQYSCDRSKASNEFNILNKNSVLNSFKPATNMNVNMEGNAIISHFNPFFSNCRKIKIKELAEALGFIDISWVNTVKSEKYGIKNRKGKTLKKNYVDPPVGGFQYDGADSYPFYWDMYKCEKCRSKHRLDYYNGNINEGG